MDMKKIFLLAAAAVLASGVSATAATLSGVFTVEAVRVTNLNGTESQATKANFDAARAGTLGAGGLGDAPFYATDDFMYTGELKFRRGGNPSTPQTISNWLASGTPGGVSGLDAGFGGLQLSTGSIGSTTATTTFFKFSLASLSDAIFEITHDDGVAVYGNGALVGATVGPTSETTSTFTGFTGGTLDFYYVATNGNPSIFEVDATPVPVPAALPMLLAGLGLAGWVGRRRKAA
jgi:hypothetical protein